VLYNTIYSIVAVIVKKMNTFCLLLKIRYLVLSVIKTIVMVTERNKPLKSTVCIYKTVHWSRVALSPF
jgi:hypothetical protein